MKKTLHLSLAVIALLTHSSISRAEGTRPNGDLLIAPSSEEAVSFSTTAVGDSSIETLLVKNLDQTPKHNVVGTMLNPHFKFLGAK